MMIRTILSMAVLGMSLGRAAVTLVAPGQPPAVIVVAADAPDSVRYAATELQQVVQQVTGATLPIQAAAAPERATIYVGASAGTQALGLNLEGLTSDGFKIVSGDGWVAILGRDYAGAPIAAWRNPWRYHEVYNEKLKLGAFGEAGTLYGVYRFLEDVCGVRWYLPGELGTVIPRRDTLRVDAPLKLQVSPRFAYRYPWFCDFSRSEADAVWYRRAGFGAPYPAQIIDSFGLFTAKHAKTHPDYFALIGGQRDFTNLSTIVGPGNLCLSNPAVAQQWVADINEYFDQNPNQSTFPLSPNDGMKKICECAACQAQVDQGLGELGKFSNYVWTFIDTVARGVAVKHPDKIVGCIAYESYTLPPTRLKKLAPNAAVMICKSLVVATDPVAIAQAQAGIAGWATKTQNIYIWEYYLYSWAPWRNFPVFFPHQIAADLKALQGVAKGQFMESESREGGGEGRIECPGMAHLNLYVTARLLWNPELDVDAMLAEYYTLFYGPAREPMREFWTMAERRFMAKGTQENPVNIYTKADMDTLWRCLEQAVAVTAPDSLYRRRVELIQVEFAPAKKRLSNTLVAQPPTLNVGNPVAPITLDGQLDDAAWQGVEPFGFVDRNGEAVTPATWGYAAWDQENLYLAFLNYEPAMKQVKAVATQRDQNFNPGLWQDDSIEIFICPDVVKRQHYYQFIVSSKGVFWDARGDRANALAPDLKWNSEMAVATRLEANRWILEVRIPFKDLGMKTPMTGQSIAANFFRNRYAGGEPGSDSCWSPTLAIQHALPERFGRIKFGATP